MKLLTKLAIVSFLLAGPCYAEVISSYWTVQKSQHFIVYYQQAESGYISQLLDSAEKYYNSIVTELGFTRFDDFWTWEKRCKIYLYPSAKEYQRATGRPSWSGGSANITERKIDTYLFEKDFLQIVLPHELGHLVFREFVGFNTSLPLWLDEGIACLQEQSSREERLKTVEGLVISGLFIPLERLTMIEANNLMMPNVFYAEAVSVIDFLLKNFGNDKFIEFCRTLRDSKDWKMSLGKVYGFKNFDDMNAQWVQYLLRDIDLKAFHDR
ncbi:MAG: peptidase MA family metallohydrolase [Candidatus Omnitrophica bacterium]|nr:peptidase MA family metallohydrolase [Candidatus Omnitrophota bacterium]